MKDNSQVIAEETKKIEEGLDERVEIINYISCLEFDVSKSFGGGNIINIRGKDGKLQQKLQEIESQIQQSLGNIEKAASVAQDQVATETTQTANNANNAQASEDETRAKQAEIDNQQSKIKEIEAKTTEISQQKQLKETELNDATQAKQDLLSNLNPEQISLVAHNNPELQNILPPQTNLSGEAPAGEVTDHPA